jgi:homoserine kinase type II
MGLEAWQALFAKCADQLDSITPGLQKWCEDELAYLSAHWPKELPAGVIHADIFPDNVFFIDGKTDQPELSGIIDFYFACNDFFIYDLLICMNAWCFNTAHRFVPERARALLAGYERLRPISEAEYHAMPTLARGAALRFLATRAHDWLNQAPGALVNPKDPMEYVAKLRFHQQVHSAGDYGL